MTPENKVLIQHLRAEGFGYSKISKLTGVNKETVRLRILNHGNEPQHVLQDLLEEEKRKADSLPPLVFRPPVNRVPIGNELFCRISAYHATMAILRSFLKKEMITKEEYDSIELHFKKQYGFEKSVIYV